MQYALRLCSQHQLTESCVQIYSAMGLYEQAVALALKVGSFIFFCEVRSHDVFGVVLAQ